MPCYEYACEKCGGRVEEIVLNYKDKKAFKKCPRCGGRCNPTIAAPAVHLLGGGWTSPTIGSETRSDRWNRRKKEHEHLPAQEPII
jgi:putative FmdB family regulatory protein